MAFNFNWSPLTADADFYKRAQEMLTTALNKSPKPPIIVDDILVNELNLGSVPPELEILEIGDLAEDRFRGIFKMCYSGDAFLTLKTRVQVRSTTLIPPFFRTFLGSPYWRCAVFSNVIVQG
jgi:mitochondrial distribution and morphology protein 34